MPPVLRRAVRPEPEQRKQSSEDDPEIDTRPISSYFLSLEVCRD